MPFSDLHDRFIDFAKGMPAVAVSADIIRVEVEALANGLKGRFPTRPATLCADLPLPAYDLAFSFFVDDLTFAQASAGGVAELEVKFRATIHPRGEPGRIIRHYDVHTTHPAQLVLENDESTRTLTWQENGQSRPTITPSWGADYEEVLEGTTIENPKKDNFIQKVEIPALWSTQNNFIKLVIDLLPRIHLDEIVPWITFQEPLRVDFRGDHVLITAARALMEVGGCTKKVVAIKPDVDFPYGEQIPVPSDSAAHVDYAIYLPRTRLVTFVADAIEPAVLVNSGRRGGAIKWQVAGSFGLKKFSADIATAINIGRPELTSAISIDATVDFLGVGRAWMDGPSGTRIGLARASVIGRGDFAVQLRFEVNLPGGFMEADLIVTKADLSDVDFGVDSRLPWPIDEVAGVVLDQVAKKEIRKLSRQVVKLGRWDFFGIPTSYEDAFDGHYFEPVPYGEGLTRVSGLVGVVRREG